MTDSLASQPAEHGVRRPPAPRMPVLPARITANVHPLKQRAPVETGVPVLCDWPGSNEQLDIPDEVLKEYGF